MAISTAHGLEFSEFVDDPVLSFFPAEAPRKPSDNLAAMRVRHLLSMSAGHDHDTTEYLWQELWPNKGSEI
jgi:CubicO group peptidase (beta-lactamase class C family)